MRRPERVYRAAAVGGRHAGSTSAPRASAIQGARIARILAPATVYDVACREIRKSSDSGASCTSLESSRHGATIDGLASELDVTTRTIRRDLAALQEAGFALYDERTDDGRVRWRIDGQALHGLESGFTLPEVCALYLSRNLLEAVAGSPFQRDLTNAFARLEKTAVAADAPVPRSPALGAGGEARPSRPRRLVLPTCSAGCSKPPCTSACTSMTYHSVSSERVKDYLVHPYRLAFAQGGMYLLAYVRSTRASAPLPSTASRR